MEDSDSMEVKKSEQVSVIEYNEDMNTRLRTLYIVLLSYVHTNTQLSSTVEPCFAVTTSVGTSDLRPHFPTPRPIKNELHRIV